MKKDKRMICFFLCIFSLSVLLSGCVTPTVTIKDDSQPSKKESDITVDDIEDTKIATDTSSLPKENIENKILYVVTDSDENGENDIPAGLQYSWTEDDDHVAYTLDGCYVFPTTISEENGYEYTGTGITYTIMPEFKNVISMGSQLRDNRDGLFIANMRYEIEVDENFDYRAYYENTYSDMSESNVDTIMESQEKICEKTHGNIISITPYLNDGTCLGKVTQDNADEVEEKIKALIKNQEEQENTITVTITENPVEIKLSELKEKQSYCYEYQGETQGESLEYVIINDTDAPVILDKVQQYHVQQYLTAGPYILQSGESKTLKQYSVSLDVYYINMNEFKTHHPKIIQKIEEEIKTREERKNQWKEKLGQ